MTHKAPPRIRRQAADRNERRLRGHAQRLFQPRYVGIHNRLARCDVKHEELHAARVCVATRLREVRAVGGENGLFGRGVQLKKALHIFNERTNRRTTTDLGMRLMFATTALEVMSTCKKAKLQSGAECGAAPEVCRDMATAAAAELMQS